MRFYLNRQNPASAIDDLNAGLAKLSPLDNFDGFLWEGDIAAGTEVRIKNKFRTQEIPKFFQVLFCKGGSQVAAGPTEWTQEWLFLKNFGGATVSLKVLFYK